MRYFTSVLITLAACTGPSSDDSGELVDSGDVVDSGDTNDTDDTDDTDDTGEPTQSEHYAFAARDGSGSSVSYSGQVFRHLLIDELEHRIDGLTGRIDSGYSPVAGDVQAELLFYLAFDSASGGDVDLSVSFSEALEQTTFNDVSSDKNLWGKLAGNDATGQHKDWSTELVGLGALSPQLQVEAWLAELDAAAFARANGTIPTGPDGAPIPSVAVTDDGRDLKQLIEKFLRVGIAFSQAADDYLDDDLDGKGLNADHSALVDGKSYTALEHAWDEGFGYFGAAQTYGSLSNEERAASSVDADGNGKIDLLTEVNWGHSANAGKRDGGSVVATDMGGDAFEAFHAGRALLASTDAALTEAELAELKGYRDDALLAWEKVIAATAIHYINETLVDSGKIGTEDYVFTDHAKHWSELKGFALGFQFNPHSPMSDADFATLHGYIGDAPVLTAEGSADAEADLLAARALLVTTYGFDSGNAGDDGGLGGW